MKTKPEVLVINSYGGSLMIAAQQEGHPLIGSFEDQDYGWQSQQLNYPDVDYRPFFADWPLDIDLRGSIVLAHPPCSGFSSQNRSKRPDGRGVTSAAFSCTVKLLDYVMPREPAVVVIESVIPALEGARAVHDHYASTYGYDSYRIVQNAASFGIPQWRKRFWIIFVKRNLSKGSFTVRLKHNLVRIGEVIDPMVGTGDWLDSHVKRMKDQWKKFGDLGISVEQAQAILQGTDYGGLIGILARNRGLSPGWKENREEFAHRYVTGGHFSSASLHLLDPNGFAPVLLSLSWSWFGNRMLDLDDYKTIMGFPRMYQFHKREMTLELLSRGVCPPIARWVLQQVRQNIFGEAPGIGPWDHEITFKPGEVADVRLPNATKGKPSGGEKR